MTNPQINMEFGKLLVNCIKSSQYVACAILIIITWKQTHMKNDSKKLCFFKNASTKKKTAKGYYRKILDPVFKYMFGRLRIYGVLVEVLLDPDTEH